MMHTSLNWLVKQSLHLKSFGLVIPSLFLNYGKASYEMQVNVGILPPY